jgi:hypothetical protein
MANVKISELPAATTPLTGAELVPIVQSGVTDQVSVANLTAGRTVAAATVNVDANSATTAVRITQTGAGNALVVEDSTNPDATPFVVDASGRVISGYTSSQSIGADIPNIQTNAGSSTNNGYGTINWTGSTGSSNFNFAKSRSTTIGTPSIVLSGDSLGKTKFFGDDGVGFIEAARIEAAVDGTPGTNDMPGRLVFSTTADGASTPTERMRIDNLGRVGFGGAAFGNSAIGVRNNMSGFGQTINYAVRISATFDSAATNSILGYSTASWTGGAGASPYTTTSVTAYDAATFTLGTNQTVTNLYGFVANSGLTVATNNYGFYSNIASGTGRWNFYANGTAANYFAGDMQLDKTVTAAGTTGAQTINKNAGTVNFAAAATSLVVTNNRVTSNSIIIATVATNDTTMKSVIAVAGAGSFTLTANAAATAETRVNWLVIN